MKTLHRIALVMCVASTACEEPPGAPAERAREKPRSAEAPDPTAVERRKEAPVEKRGKASTNGDSTKFPFGYYDVSGRGAARDFCQVLRDRPGLHCDTGERVVSYAGILDLGYDGTGRMTDVNGDGRDDFCRCVGDAPTIRFSCLLATADGFAKEQFGFDPPGRRECDPLNASQSPPPAPTAVPAPTQAQIAEPTKVPPSSCSPGNMSPCSCGGAPGQKLCDAQGRFGPCDCRKLAMPTGPCTFGTMKPCGCAGGAQGVTVCDGKRWEPCAC